MALRLVLLLLARDGGVGVVVVDRDVVVHGAVGDTRSQAIERPRIEDIEQRGGSRRRPLGAQEQIARSNRPAVQLGVRILALDDGTTLQADTCEQPLCLAVAEDTRDALQARGTGRLGIAADGPGGERYVPAEGEGPGLGECLYGGGVVEDEDEVGQLEANLATEARAAGGDGRGGGPGAVGEAGDDEAGAEAGGAEEAGFDDGEDCKALGKEEDGLDFGGYVEVTRKRKLKDRSPKGYVFEFTLACCRTAGGMTLSGPKDCRGSTKAARILPHFLHSARSEQCCQLHCYCGIMCVRSKWFAMLKYTAA